jgi:hypothetical protein
MQNNNIIKVYYKNQEKIIRLLKNLKLGNLMKVILKFYNEYIFAIEDFVIEYENGDKKSFNEIGLDYKIFDIGDLTRIKILLLEREKDEDGNIKNRENILINKYINFLRISDDNKIALDYQDYIDNNIPTLTNDENSEYNRSINYYNLLRSVNGLNSTYDRLNRRYSPRSYNSLNSQTNNYNNLYSQFLNSFGSTNQNVTDEIIDVEVTYNSSPENDEEINDEEIDVSGNSVENNSEQSCDTEQSQSTGTSAENNLVQSSNSEPIQSTSTGSNLNWFGNSGSRFYESIMNNFTDIINRNNNTDRPISGFSLQYQTVPLNSYSNMLNSFMGMNGTYLNTQPLNEDVKMVLTESEISNLKKMKLKDVSGINHESEHKCTVCLENMSEEDEVILLDCKHFFHKKCIETWFKECSNKCPICMATVARGVPDFRRRGV